jgi:chemotaxis signal transduction protein
MSVSTSESDDAGGSAAKHVEFVRVDLCGETYVFELGRVNQLVRSPSLTRVPRTPPTIAGVTEIQGHVTVAIDGRTLLGADDREGGDSSRILVVFAPTAHDQSAGLLIDDVGGIETHPVDVIEPANTATKGPDDRERGWLKAVIDGDTWVFDPEGLIEAARSE